MLNKKIKVPENGQIEVFDFNPTSTKIRSMLIDGEPWFLANDIASALKYANPRKATLDHCKEKGVVFCNTVTEGGVQKMKWINEGNLYRLIINCNLPVAEVFEAWIFDELLPTIRKKGYYGVRRTVQDYVDVRDIPYQVMTYLGGDVRVVDVDGERWYSLNDIHSCIGARTDSSQSVRRLNAKRELAKKMWLYGVPNPGWMVPELGVRLLLCASHKNRENAQLMLDFDGKEGGR